MLDTTFQYRQDIIGNSPYAGATIDEDVDNAFLGLGMALSSFSALYDMFGKFLSGFDVESIWSNTFNKIFSEDEITTIKEDSNLIDRNAEPELMMRDINAVDSSSFIIAKAQREDSILKRLYEQNSEQIFGLLYIAQNKVIQAMNWQKDAIMHYAIIIKNYLMTLIDRDEANYDNVCNNILWPFFVLDFERTALSAMNRGAFYNKIVQKRKRSDLSKVLLVASYTAYGAVYGSMFGPGWGTFIGACIGFCVGVAIVMSE